MLDKSAYTIDELAKSGPIGRSNLFKAIKAGALIARKAGRRTVVLKDDYERFLISLPVAKARQSDHAA